MTRTLASIQRITDIQPIEGADAIEVASVLGWKVVIRKGEFQVGDLAVYLEIDSVPPDEEQYRFLWRNAEVRPNNFRIKTIKLRGQISQGILFPAPKYERDPEIYKFWPFDPVWAVEGADVTDFLNVTKYEAPLLRGSSDVEGQFFDGVPKTDEERVQSSTGQKHLADLQGKPYYITVKCDGASMTIAMHDDQVKVASRNYRLADVEGSAYWSAARRPGKGGTLIDFVQDAPWCAVQGELVGPGIQNNRLGFKEHRCLVFDMYDRRTGTYLTWNEMRHEAKGYGFDLVPLVYHSENTRDDLFNYSADGLLALAEAKYDGTTNEREGIVIRSAVSGERVSVKAISNRFLLKGGE